jgi:hypothetical protein
MFEIYTDKNSKKKRENDVLFCFNSLVMLKSKQLSTCWPLSMDRVASSSPQSRLLSRGLEIWQSHRENG